MMGKGLAIIVEFVRDLFGLAKKKSEADEAESKRIHDETQAENDEARKERAGVTPSVDAAGRRTP